MNNVSYTVGDPEVLSPQSNYIISRTPTEHAHERVSLASCKKLLCMTVKTAKDIRVVCRNGKYSETTLPVSIRGLTSTENFPQHPQLFFGISEKAVVIINPNVQASGTINISTQVVNFEETVFSAIPGGEHYVLVLCTHTIYTVDERNGKIVNSSSHSAKLSDGQGFDFHSTARLLAIPSKSALSILSLDLMRSILSTTWEPHSVPTSFTRFFQRRKFAEEATDDVLILTAAEKNSELRFWSFNQSTKRFALKGGVTLMAGNGVTALDFDISVTPCEEYIVLCSKTDDVAVIMEVDRGQFKVGKITTWKTPGKSKMCATQLNMISVSKSVTMQLFITIRTGDSFAQVLVDEKRIASAANMRRMDSPTNWFAQGGLPVIPLGNQQRLTSVSSSLHGDYRALNTSNDNNAASVVMEQVSSMSHELKKVDTELSKIQKGASQTMRILESKTYEQLASKLGKEFAKRNKERLVLGPQANEKSQSSASEGILTESQQVLLLSVEGYTSSLRGMTQNSTQSIISALLEQELVVALEKASDDLMNYDGIGSSQLYISDSALTSSVQSSVNSVCADIKNSLKKLRADIPADRGESINTLQNTVEQFLARTMVSLDRLKEDLKETKSLTEKVGIPQTPGSINPGAFLAKCLSMGEAGDWPGALRAALHASDTSILLNFLECEPCRESMAMLTKSSAIELADFLSLCLQLSFRIESVPGAIPSRLEYLHMFLVEWDDYLQETKKRRAHDDRCAAMFKLISDELTRVLEALAAVDSKTLQRPFRTKYMLTKKIIGQLIM